MLEGRLETFQWHEVEKLRGAGICLLNEREPKEWEAGDNKGAQHIPFDQLRERLQELPRNETSVFTAIQAYGDIWPAGFYWQIALGPELRWRLKKHGLLL
ncbi:rhodanese-like domain-containing protein [Nafulsella turpanensis]|uniref:hypothetical protein n=1 Tax=Nafulsella turpanensis TaxID=1265690 RepID=UPI000345F589|nr:hypothetical protein [Nafulsella turpanensis]